MKKQILFEVAEGKSTNDEFIDVQLGKNVVIIKLLVSLVKSSLILFQQKNSGFFHPLSFLKEPVN